MSIIAAAVKHLLAAGVTGDALLSAIAEMEAQVRAEPKQRSAAAERQARYEARKRQKASETSDLTLSDENDASDASDEFTSLSRPPNEINSNPPTHTHREVTSGASEAGELDASLADGEPAPELSAAAAKRAKAKRAVAAEVPMPESWEPVLTERAQKIVDGWPPGMIECELMAFEAHAAKYDRVTKDWQAAFRTWIARAERDRAERNENRSAGGGRGSTGNHQYDDRQDGLQLVLAERIAKRRGVELAP